jgi:hypothetical protein
MLGLALGALAMHAAASAAVAAPAVVHGWPVPAPAGSVHPGPEGGVVVIGAVGDALAVAVAAHRPGGGLRWAAVHTPGCGNCDCGPQVESLQPDGTYGLIGVTGDDSWAVDGGGHIVAGCTGTVQADGTCISVTGR